MKLVTKFSAVLLHSQDLQIKHLDVLKDHLVTAKTVLGQVNPIQDQGLFIDYNTRLFSVPADWTFEPCSSHYDSEEMSIEPAPKVFLQNKLSRCRVKLEEVTALVESKRRESAQLSNLVVAYTHDHSLGNVDDISNDYLEAKQQMVFYATSECILKGEIDTIVTALGGTFQRVAIRS